MSCGDREVLAEPEVVVIAGYTGRDRAAVLEHIRELEQHGVAPPPTVPTFYAVSPQLLTQGAKLVTVEVATSGEAEVALVSHRGELFVTLASDHTDREAERVDVCLAKRACHKVVASTAWPLDEVIGHWDLLQLRSWVGSSPRTLYQDGTLAALMPPGELLEAIPWKDAPADYLVLCGTVPAIGGVRPSSWFKAELLDSQTDRRLEVEYEVQVADLLRAVPSAGPARLAGRSDGRSSSAYLDRVTQVCHELGVELAQDDRARLASRLAAMEQQLLP